MDNKGGRVAVSIDGLSASPRGEGAVKPARAVVEVGVNMDGTGFGTVRPKLSSFEVSFDRGQRLFTWGELQLLPKVNVTVRELDTGVMWLFTGSRWVGEPSINLATGEVTGMSIHSDQVQMVRA